MLLSGAIAGMHEYCGGWRGNGIGCRAASPTIWLLVIMVAVMARGSALGVWRARPDGGDHQFPESFCQDPRGEHVAVLAITGLILFLPAIGGRNGAFMHRR